MGNKIVKPVSLLLVLAAGCSAKLPISFPKSFRFGMATVAHQSEGTQRADGSVAASNWSEWEDMGRVPCHPKADGCSQSNPHGNGFYDGYAEDLDLSAKLGANAFSYAVDWARLEPQAGVFDDAEVQRIVSIVTAMRQRGMKPLIVLFHWVTPTWVQSPKSGVDLLARRDQAFSDAFVPMVEKLVPVLAGLVDDWVTFEEPFSIIGGEYLEGEDPPGHTLNFKEATYALFNLAYLNARTYKRVHELDTEDADGDGIAATVGMENLAIETYPLTTAPEDVTAAKRIDYIANLLFLNAVTSGDVDINLDGKIDPNAGTDPPEGNYPELAHTVDFIGLNYYQRVRVDQGYLGMTAPIFATPHYKVTDYDASLPHSDEYQEISSHGLRAVIEEYSRYKLPLVVSETGLADADDDQRPYYLLDHLYTTAKAIADGYDVRGFYCWTISDNFEWAQGVDARFGVYHVDFTQPGFPRTPLKSAQAFSDIAHAGKIDQTIWTRWALPSYPVGIP